VIEAPLGPRPGPDLQPGFRFRRVVGDDAVDLGVGVAERGDRGFDVREGGAGLIVPAAAV